MNETQYGLKVSLPVTFEAAVASVTQALGSQGFGVLTTIDVQQTLKVKLNRDFRKYVILGACSPPLADRALHAELEIGPVAAVQRDRLRDRFVLERRRGDSAAGGARRGR